MEEKIWTVAITVTLSVCVCVCGRKKYYFLLFVFTHWLHHFYPMFRNLAELLSVVANALFNAFIQKHTQLVSIDRLFASSKCSPFISASHKMQFTGFVCHRHTNQANKMSLICPQTSPQSLSLAWLFDTNWNTCENTPEWSTMCLAVFTNYLPIFNDSLIRVLHSHGWHLGSTNHTKWPVLQLCVSEH